MGHLGGTHFRRHEQARTAPARAGIRTSVDHGTAFDIAGQGIAKPDSLLEALKVAATLAQSSLVSQ